MTANTLVTVTTCQVWRTKLRTILLRMLCFSKSRVKTYKPKLDLTETVIIAQRYKVNERAVAYITSAVLHAALKAVIISSEQSSDITSAWIVDKNKIRRRRLTVARNLKQRSTDDDLIKSLYFDGRKDETKTQTGIFREEHISLVAKPNSQNVGHVTPSSGFALDEMTVIFEYITMVNFIKYNSKVYLMKLMCLDVTEQTPITGWKGGILRKLEELTCKPM
ncbi:hypothetical protein AVEN_16425-1 [Araneus ventricosus]|uniref:Uncharacterized protein n=1 Tax=Araneus ventricosus TaxID=182803 RepID=A0A4Y2EYK1_ARAVE|nr:hypothetical protein AVEN_16425-1 [Araneus ventricosus]